MPRTIWDQQIRNWSGWKIPQLKWATPWLYIYGTAGSGKTTTARWYVSKWSNYEIINTVEFIEFLRAADGNKRGIRNDLDTLHLLQRVAIDDLGSEPDDYFTADYSKYTPADVFETALFMRDRPDQRTIITSNLNLDSLLEKYGEKIHSRAMANATVYNFQGDRRQGQKFKMKLVHEGGVKAKLPICPPKPEGELQQPPMTEEQRAEAIAKAPPALRPYFKRMAEQIEAATKKNGGK